LIHQKYVPGNACMTINTNHVADTRLASSQTWWVTPEHLPPGPSPKHH
jgi:hypothetical protein